MRYALVLLAVLLVSCAAPPVAASPTASSTASTTSAPTASATVALTASPAATARSVRAIASVGGRAFVSPDGKWIAAPEPPPGGKTPYVPAVNVFDLDGKLVRRIEAPGGAWRWMSDSTGLFVALDAPQRSPALGIVDIATGASRDTGLQMAGASLTNDGKWLVADHQEGCCIALEQREIWIAARSGGGTRLFARSATERQQPVGVIGIDPQDRVVYRDHDQIMRQAIAGGTAQGLGSLASPTVLWNDKDGRDGDVSPDGMVMLVRTIDPVRWHVVANDRVTPWADNLGAIVEDRQGLRLQYYSAALWIGPHTLLARSASGELSAVDMLTGLPTPLKASLGATDLPLAHDHGRLLVARGRLAVLIDLASGREIDTGLDLTNEIEGSHASALPGGGFILSTALATYRID